MDFIIFMDTFWRAFKASSYATQITHRNNTGSFFMFVTPTYFEPLYATQSINTLLVTSGLPLGTFTVTFKMKGESNIAIVRVMIHRKKLADATGKDFSEMMERDDVPCEITFKGE